MTNRPSLLLYCQHSLGLGHLVRSLALARALAGQFRVVLLNGGLFPEGITVPRKVEVVDLPPLGMSEDGTLISRDPRYSVAEAQRRRLETMLAVFQALRPAVLFIELFPFGRRKFAGELLPLLDAARGLGSTSPVILCSLRDILVNGRAGQAEHDERASVLANRYFDAVLVHSDPGFARLEDSFCPRTPLAIPVHYSGFVIPESSPPVPTPVERRHEIIVSAGGGLVGEPLLRAAVEAHRRLWPSQRLATRLIAGPFFPERAWSDLLGDIRTSEGLSLDRCVPDLVAAMAASAASVSQCGYNTALDVLRSGVPALVVPYGDGGENEQMHRARRLERAGALRVLDPMRLNGITLAEEIAQLLRFTPQPVALDVDGAVHSARIVARLVQDHCRVDPADTLVEAAS